MARNWTEITNEIMTNLYLYGQETKPTELVSESLIGPRRVHSLAVRRMKIHHQRLL